MEYCQGNTLKHYYKSKNGKLSADQFIHLIDQIIDAALKMNEKGVIHRDLKP